MLADHREQQPPGSFEARVFYRTLVAAILAQVAEVDANFKVLEGCWPQV
jgi:hypothetical protein